MPSSLMVAGCIIALLVIAAPSPARDQSGRAPSANDNLAPQPTNVTPNPAAAASLKAVIRCRRGEIVMELFPDKAPLTVANFVNLAQRHFYDGLTFYRVIAGSTVEGGCPLNKGIAGPGYKFEDEFHPALKHNAPGAVSMANLGPNTNGSRFLIDLRPNPPLDGRNAVFGRVVEGLEVVQKLAAGDVIDSLRIEGDASTLLARFGPRLAEWNRALDARFHLSPAPPRGSDEATKRPSDERNGRSPIPNP